MPKEMSVEEKWSKVPYLVRKVRLEKAIKNIKETELYINSAYDNMEKYNDTRKRGTPSATASPNLLLALEKRSKLRAEINGLNEYSKKHDAGRPPDTDPKQIIRDKLDMAEYAKEYVQAFLDPQKNMWVGRYDQSEIEAMQAFIKKSETEILQYKKELSEPKMNMVAPPPTVGQNNPSDLEVRVDETIKNLNIGTNTSTSSDLKIITDASKALQNHQKTFLSSPKKPINHEEFKNNSNNVVRMADSCVFFVPLEPRQSLFIFSSKTRPYRRRAISSKSKDRSEFNNP